MDHWIHPEPPPYWAPEHSQACKSVFTGYRNPFCITAAQYISIMQNVYEERWEGVSPNDWINMTSRNEIRTNRALNDSILITDRELSQPKKLSLGSIHRINVIIGYSGERAMKKSKPKGEKETTTLLYVLYGLNRGPYGINDLDYEERDEWEGWMHGFAHKTPDYGPMPPEYSV